VLKCTQYGGFFDINVGLEDGVFPYLIGDKGYSLFS
jgi:hypothetical protein